MILDDMKTRLPELRAGIEQLRRQARLEEAWVNLPKSMVGQALLGDLEDAMNKAMKAAVAKEATDIQMRSDAAEARVYSKLLARPEMAVVALEGITQSIIAAETEIRKIESVTKGV